MNVELSLGGGHTVRLDRRGDVWNTTVGRHRLHRSHGADGPAEALLQLVRGDDKLPDRWDLLRLTEPPDVSGERVSESEGPNRSDIIGEQVVVTWVQRLIDGPHPAPAALAQLSAAGFAEMPTPYALLTWTSPRGHVLPVAVVSSFLPGANEGWQWCMASGRAFAAAVADGAVADGAVADGAAARPPATLDNDPVGHPARTIGTVAADLHAALARPTAVFARPVHAARPATVRAWHADGLALLERGRQVGDSATTKVLDRHAEEIRARLDRDLGPDAPLTGTPVLHIHGDLHVGQVLRWDGGVAVVDFDGDPVLGGAPALAGPPAWDVAELLRSLDHAGRRLCGEDSSVDAEAVRQWVERSRAQCLAAYRERLAYHGQSGLLDDRLLAPLELLHALREVVYAAEHMPSWSYAPRAAIDDLLATTA